jgi:hypothetical protein
MEREGIRGCLLRSTNVPREKIQHVHARCAYTVHDDYRSASRSAR